MKKLLRKLTIVPFLIGALALVMLPTLLVSCGMTPATPTGQIGVNAGPNGENPTVNGGLSWDATTNINLAATGSVDQTGNWNAGFVITFKEVPDQATQIQLRTVRAVHIVNVQDGIAFLIPARGRSLNDPELQNLFACAAGSPGGYTLQRIK